MLNLEFYNPAKKFLKKCEKDIRERIMDRIRLLRINPFPHDVVRVEGEKNKTFRIRVGKCRITYVVITEDNVLIIADIDKRDRIYDK